MDNIKHSLACGLFLKFIIPLEIPMIQKIGDSKRGDNCMYKNEGLLNNPTNNSAHNEVNTILGNGRIAQVTPSLSNELFFCFIDTPPHLL